MEEMKNYALMIDADNVSAKYVKIIFDELSSYGTVSIRRIYGNWAKNYDWNESVLLEYSIQPIHQFDYTKGKNATDMLMVIDAMDLLYSGNVDGFCIVTSDSDFTKLAMRLREDRMYVIGMGESKTPAALVKACDRFVHLDLIAEEESKHTPPAKRKNEIAVTSVEQIEEEIISYINSSESEEAISLSSVGSRLKQKFTDFDVRNYGYSQLSVFIREKCGRLKLENKKNGYCVSIGTEIDLELVRREIVEMIERNGGVIRNLSVIYEELRKANRHFSLKNYGFSRTSSFLRSFPELDVSENTVCLKKEKPSAKSKRSSK
ncbi:MAG: NYN domain-containing protein [Bacteroides sp.]|nr:NYN domain-containing protein [Eubacterium sp.]MCM1417214.1 NYN domain-containing protein [Roseburia sp.]MCM1461165.1 NYN domain-containing protein [Bacteroides sp.]